MIDVAIFGAAGYTGGELLRILNKHPRVGQIRAISQSHAGQKLNVVHRDLLNDGEELFLASLAGESFDVIFLCAGHGEARAIIGRHQLTDFSGLIIDLSQDFRLSASDHNFVYGLPELFPESIPGSKRIANPGCFATAIQLAAAPLAQRAWLKDALHITGITGATGAGQKLQDSQHFAWRHDNLSVYKAFEHQHLAEIKQSLGQLQAKHPLEILFVPMRGAFTRGILVSLHTRCDASPDELQNAYRQYYAKAEFVHIRDEDIDLKTVVNTNNALLSVQKHGDYAHIVCSLDNLLKGACGTAVQNMNRALGFADHEGLRLKPQAF